MLRHFADEFDFSEQGTHIRLSQGKHTGIGVEVTIVATGMAKRNMQVERSGL